MVELEFTLPNGETDRIEIDATVRETHTLTATVTEHPVEAGASVVDHVRPEQPRITLEGVISNTPIRVPGTHMDGATGRVEKVELGEDRAANVLRFSGPFDRVGTVRDLLAVLIDSGTLVTIRTSLLVYEDMVLHRLEIPRDAGLGNTLRFTMDAVRIRLVDTQTVEAPEETRGRHSRRRGAQAAEDADGPTSESSSALMRIPFVRRAVRGVE